MIKKSRNYKIFKDSKSMKKIDFIIRYGVIRWGLATGILYSILSFIVDGKKYSLKLVILELILKSAIFSLGGYVFELVLWNLYKKKE